MTQTFFTARRLTATILLLSVVAGCAVPAIDQTGVRTGVTAGVVRADDGVPVVYDVRGAGDTALLFVHCWACSRAVWRHQLDAFSDRYRVVSLDLPGHGESGAERAQWSVAGLAADVSKVIRTLDLKQVVLVGHSMGGPVSLLVAHGLTQRVKGVACVDTLHDASVKWPQEMAEDLAQKLEADFDGVMSELLIQLFRPGADPEVVDWVRRQALRTDKPAAIELLRAFPDFSLEDALARADVPIRCINAQPLPPMIPPTAIDVNRRYADFDAVVMDGVGHYPMLERPDEFNERLGAVLEALEGR